MTKSNLPETISHLRANKLKRVMKAIVLLLAMGVLMPQLIKAETYNVGDSTSLASALTNAAAGGDTIKLSASFTYNTSITISSKSITFNLNGFTLEVLNSVNNASYGLRINNSGELSLTGAGALNVTGSNGVSVDANCKLTVTNVTATSTVASANRGYGISAQTGSIVNVLGNLSATRLGVYIDGDNAGISIQGDVNITHPEALYGITFASSGRMGNTLTLEGAFNVPGGVPCIMFWIGGANTAFTLQDTVSPTTKPGYYTYTEGNNTVWVRDPDAVSISPWITTNEQLSIYPNPTTGNLQVTTPGLQVERIDIFDVSGKKLVTFNLPPETHILDISHLSNGVYFIKIKTANGEEIKKIIKT